MAAPVAKGAVEIEGLRALRRDLRAIDRALPREVTAALKNAAGPVIGEARRLAPHKSGRLSGSIKAYSARGGVAVGSRLPYANVIHWGGTTGRGHRPGVAGSGSVKVRASQFIERAVAGRRDELIDHLGDELEQLAARHGFKR